MSEHVTPSDFVHDLKPYPYVPEAREKQRIIDPVGVMLSREQRGREQIIAQEMVKIVREEITKCYQREGTNHYQNCKHLTKQRVAGAVRRARRGPARRRGPRSTPPPGRGATSDATTRLLARLHDRLAARVVAFLGVAAWAVYACARNGAGLARGRTTRCHQPPCTRGRALEWLLGWAGYVVVRPRARPAPLRAQA